jgi:hypothetical protein
VSSPLPPFFLQVGENIFFRSIGYQGVPFLAGQKGDNKDHGRRMTDRGKELTKRVLPT